MDNPHTIKAYDKQATELYYKENRTPEEDQRLEWLTTEEQLPRNVRIIARVILVLLVGIIIGLISK